MEEVDEVEQKEEETQAQQETVATVEPPAHSVEQKRGSDDKSGQTTISLLEGATLTPKHSKLSKKTSLISQNSGENGYSTPPGERRLVGGSFRRVRSGGKRPVSMVTSHSLQSSESGSRKGSEANLRLGGSLDTRKTSLTVYRTVSIGYETEDEGNVYYSTSRPGWGFDQIAMDSDSDSELEFFDAKGNVCSKLHDS